MKFTLALLAFLISSVSFAFNAPNSALTPGVVDNHVSKEVLCSPGYLQAHLNVPQNIKQEVLKRYGLLSSEGVDIDNLVGVEVGGSQLDIRNLWPQNISNQSAVSAGNYGIEEKNIVERNLYERICSGSISMADAQQIERSGEWRAYYKRLMTPATAANQ